MALTTTATSITIDANAIKLKTDDGISSLAEFMHKHKCIICDENTNDYEMVCPACKKAIKKLRQQYDHNIMG